VTITVVVVLDVIVVVAVEGVGQSLQVPTVVVELLAVVVLPL
jgi:hypothetical protein